MYKPNIGLDHLMMSWGHDEYMYQVLVHNKTTLPKHALNIIRFHSFYPWHNGGDYEYLMKPEDEITKKWVLTFKWAEILFHFFFRFNTDWLLSSVHSRYDLYTKASEIPDIEALWPYYQSLIDKYLPGELEWWRLSLISSHANSFSTSLVIFIHSNNFWENLFFIIYLNEWRKYVLRAKSWERINKN